MINKILSEEMSYIKNLVTSCSLTLAISHYIKLSNAAPVAEWLMRPPGSTLAWGPKVRGFETHRGIPNLEPLFSSLNKEM
ncbi:hypothetical protein I7I53_04044 [Histoplasma capsulatum var. duboisii H88]|uniref:Uncharacterized protein n=1 Tax=Ajellomyces capsulatus (strain H88) TaxID=544711 RepID=A0A8A1LRN1_AJEC8|nr:hypothetical protein I7I53_04044 [Histoplasma capsulatum var. duboisii H88]